MQAIRRGRGVRRTVDRPLDVLVLSDVVLPIPVDELIPDEKPSLSDLMLATGGIAYEDAAAAALAYPDLWPSAKAARKAFQRCGTLPNRELFIGRCPALLPIATVAYRRVGQGQRQAWAVVDLRQHPNPKGGLEQALGPLAFIDGVESNAVIEAVEATILDFPAPQQHVEEFAQQYAHAREDFPPPEYSVAAITEFTLQPEGPGYADQYARAREEGAGEFCNALKRVDEEPVVIDFDAVRMALGDGQVRMGDLADELSMSPSNLSNIFAGRRRLKPPDAARLAKIAASIRPVQGRLL